MCASRESWFYEGGFEADCRSLNLSSDPARSLHEEKVIMAGPWSADEEYSELDDAEVAAMEGGNRAEASGFRLFTLVLGVAALAAALLISFYCATLYRAQRLESPLPSVPIDEAILRQLPAKPGNLPRFLEQMSDGHTRTPLLAAC